MTHADVASAPASTKAERRACSLTEPHATKGQSNNGKSARYPVSKCNAIVSETATESRVRLHDEAGEARDDRRQRLIVKKLRGAESYVGKPGLQRKMGSLELECREPHHLLMQRAVIQIWDRDRLRTEVDEIP